MVARRTVLLGLGAAAAAGTAGLWSAYRRMGSTQEYTAAMDALRARLPAAPQTADLIRFATLAATSHNTQAWSFHAAANAITSI